ncbi:hypothetical protein CHRYSEOSP005_24330 [Chryseobacterium sp. Alg-005]|uniref:transposase n=1 Tax=Chryseobacterium sp. Alg-005 TaxID=3159516 RepID=UPI003555A8A8
MNLKDIHIGHLIKVRFEEVEMSLERACKFLKCHEKDIVKMYGSSSIDTDILLRWSKLLEYDFFRLYSGHLILYSPPAAPEKKNQKKIKQSLPVFRKNIYTQEIKDFIIGKVKNGHMTVPEAMNAYNIPKTTIYKWMKKS